MNTHEHNAENDAPSDHWCCCEVMPMRDCPIHGEFPGVGCWHEWLDRPESDTYECLLCGLETSVIPSEGTDQ